MDLEVFLSEEQENMLLNAAPMELANHIMSVENDLNSPPQLFKTVVLRKSPLGCWINENMRAGGKGIDISEDDDNPTIVTILPTHFAVAAIEGRFFKPKLCSNNFCLNPSHVIEESREYYETRISCDGQIICSIHLDRTLVDTCDHEPMCVKITKVNICNCTETPPKRRRLD